MLPDDNLKYYENLKAIPNTLLCNSNITQANEGKGREKDFQIREYGFKITIPFETKLQYDKLSLRN